MTGFQRTPRLYTRSNQYIFNNKVGIRTAKSAGRGNMASTSSISQQIWDMKYRFKNDDGTPVDKTMTDTFRRIATALAAPEKDPDHWREKFYSAMSDFKFLPAGQ